jgi:hypothetical protein
MPVLSIRPSHLYIATDSYQFQFHEPVNTLQAFLLIIHYYIFHYKSIGH